MPARNHRSYPIYIRELQVRESFAITPSMHRIVLGGDQLGAFENNGYGIAPFATENADDHVKLVIPDPEGQLAPPIQNDGQLDWPPETLSRARDYTPRRFDPVTGRLELDFACHDGGLASAWALSARVGDTILVAGPRGTTVLPDDVDWFFLVGDETALPAIARRIEELAPGTPVTAIVSVPSAADEQTFTHRTDLDITWVHRDRTGPSTPPDPTLMDAALMDAVLMDAVRAGRWSNGQVYAWAAGEAAMLRPVRRWLRDERKVDRDHLDVAGYWRAGQSQHEMATAQMKLRDRVDLAFGYAVRAVVTLGVAELVADGQTDIDVLAERCRVQSRGLRKVLRVLAREGLFTLTEDGRVGLTRTGAVLTEDFVHARLDRASGTARLDDAWPHLLSTLQTGRSGFERVTGATFFDTLAADPLLGDSFDASLAEWSGHWADPLAEQLKLTDDVVVDVGGGTGTVLGRLLTQAPQARGVLVELPTTAARARRQFEHSGMADRITIAEQSFFAELPAGGDRYLLAQVLHDWPDGECRAILGRVADAAGDAPVHIIERLPSADDHDHDLTFDLQLYSVFGGGERSAAEYARLAEQAGLELVESTPLHDDLQLLTLRRR